MNNGISKVATAIAGPNATAIEMLNIGLEYWKVDRTVPAPGPDLSAPGNHYVWITPDIVGPDPEAKAAAVRIRVKAETDTVMRICAFSDESLAKYGGDEAALLEDAPAFDVPAGKIAYLDFALDVARSLGIKIEEGALALTEVTWILSP
jgi:hypothetical protein